MPKRVHEDVHYQRMNHTELVQLAQFNNIPGACLGTPREVLIHALLNMEPAGENPIDKFREKYSAFILRYLDMAMMQLPYDRCRRGACHLSHDAQVVKCWLENRDQVM